MSVNKEAYKDYLQGRQLKRAAWNKIYKKVLFDGIKYPVGKLAEDYGTTYKLLSKAQTILINETVIYGYYQRTDSIMGTRSLKLLKDEYFLGCEYYVFSKTNYDELEFLVNTEHLNLLIKSYSRLRLHRDYKKDKEEVDKLLLEIHDKICGMRIMNINFAVICNDKLYNYRVRNSSAVNTKNEKNAISTLLARYYTYKTAQEIFRDETINCTNWNDTYLQLLQLKKNILLKKLIVSSNGLETIVQVQAELEKCKYQKVGWRIKDYLYCFLDKL